MCRLRIRKMPLGHQYVGRRSLALCLGKLGVGNVNGSESQDKSLDRRPSRVAFINEKRGQPFIETISGALECCLLGAANVKCDSVDDFQLSPSAFKIAGCFA